MVRPQIKQATALTRKQIIPESDRTPARDEVAEYIQREFVDGDRDWQSATFSAIAEEVGRSREHVAQTVDRYFDPASSGPDLPALFADQEVPDGGDDYRAGYRQGYWDGLRDAVEHADTLREWFESE